jgi:hypothetical protein
MPTPRTRFRPVAWLALAIALTGVAASVTQGEETEAGKALKRARRTGAELIQTGQFAQAVRFLRRAAADYSEDAELHRLLAAAALDRAMELDNQLDAAVSRLFLVSQIRATLGSMNSPAFKEAQGPVSAAVTDAAQTYQKNLSTRFEVKALLDEAVTAAQTAIHQDGPASPAVLMAAWIDAYRIIQADSARKLGLRFDQIQAAGGPPAPPSLTGSGRPGGSFDRKAVRRHALHLLSRMAQGRPDDPRPYLAAAEWLQLVELGEGDFQSKLYWQRNRRFREGVVDRDHELTDRAARDEYETARRTPIGDLEAVGIAQILALYERAAQLDPKDECGTAYALYIQVLPGDEARAKALLAKLALQEPGNALIPLEQARQAAANGDQDGMLRLLDTAAAATRFHRRLFTTLPADIREPFLSAHLVWKSLSETGFGFNYIQRVILLLFRSRQSPAEREPLHLLRSRLGALLMQSDLPQDWVFGAELRRGALDALSRDPGLPPNLAAQVQIGLQRTRSEIASRPLPLQTGILWQNRLLMESTVGDDLTITSPCIIASRDGGTMVGQ